MQLTAPSSALPTTVPQHGFSAFQGAAESFETAGSMITNPKDVESLTAARTMAQGGISLLGSVSKDEGFAGRAAGSAIKLATEGVEALDWSIKMLGHLAAGREVLIPDESFLASANTAKLNFAAAVVALSEEGIGG